MCGRFKFKAEPGDLQKLFKDNKKILSCNPDTKTDPELTAFVPTDNIYSIFCTNGEYNLGLTTWGIQLTPKTAFLFNIQIEKILERPFWKKQFTKCKCLIPVTAFYKMFRQSHKKKERQKITINDSNIFFFAGIYKLETDNIFSSLITVPPNKTLGQFYKRIPAVFGIKEAIEYLNNDYNSNLNLIRLSNEKTPFEIEKLKAQH